MWHLRDLLCQILVYFLQKYLYKKYLYMYVINLLLFKLPIKIYVTFYLNMNNYSNKENIFCKFKYCSIKNLCYQLYFLLIILGDLLWVRPFPVPQKETLNVPFFPRFNKSACNICCLDPSSERSGYEYQNTQTVSIGRGRTTTQKKVSWI